MQKLLLLVCVASVMQANAQTDATPSAALDSQVHSILAAPAVARAHWGIAVSTLDGTPVYALDEDKLFRPASTAKLFTTAAAMALLGPDSRRTTHIFGALDVTTGTVRHMVLVGAGDPSFGTNDLPYTLHKVTAPAPQNSLSLLADQLLARGVRGVEGAITGDDSLFAREGPPAGWAEEDLLWSYGALPSALPVANDEIELLITANGTTVNQLAPYVHTRPAQEHSGAGVDVRHDAADAHGFLITTPTAPLAAPVNEHIAVPEPALYAAEALRAALELRGVSAVSQARAIHAVDKDACDSIASQPVSSLLAAFTSPPLSQEIAYTLKTSANLHAEVLLRLLAAGAPASAPPCGGLRSADGLRTLQSWLLQAGVGENDVTLYDGSGLSTKDLVTPRAEVELLLYAAKQPWFEQWKAALPVGGVDGTLAGRFTASPLKGKVFAKTGTLGESRALAGYVQCASGKELIFAILDDDHLPGNSADRAAMDKMVEAIAAAN